MAKRKLNDSNLTEAVGSEKSNGAEVPEKPAAKGKGAVEKKAAPAKKAAGKKAVAKTGEKEPSFWHKTRQFFREVRIELKKVTWPTRKETIASTSVVLVLVILVAIYLGLVDGGLSRLLNALLR